MTIRSASPGDIPAITGIYAHSVLHSAATFEVEPPSLEEMARRYHDLQRAGFPYLVAERDNAVIGYAYTSLYRSRPAYRHTIEDSIYVHPDHLGQGLGKALLGNLIQTCQQREWRQMIAVIGDSGNLASIRLHQRFGFRHAGVLQGVGFKFGRWVDTVLMQRELRNSVPT